MSEKITPLAGLRQWAVDRKTFFEDERKKVKDESELQGFDAVLFELNEFIEKINEFGAGLGERFERNKKLAEYGLIIEGKTSKDIFEALAGELKLILEGAPQGGAVPEVKFRLTDTEYYNKTGIERSKAQVSIKINVIAFCGCYKTEGGDPVEMEFVEQIGDDFEFKCPACNTTFHILVREVHALDQKGCEVKL